MITPEEIISLLPYKKPFLFVDAITIINENTVEGEYRFTKDEFFYKGHFFLEDESGNKNNVPVTPGVILIETMAQIGVASLGIYLLARNTQGALPGFALTSGEAEFFQPVFPEEKVIVNSQKIYFRFGKLKCSVRMKNEKDDLICKGVISGMIKNFSNKS